MQQPEDRPDVIGPPTNSSPSRSADGEHEISFLVKVKTFGHEEKVTKDLAKTILSRLGLALLNFEVLTPDGDWRYWLDDDDLVVEPVIINDMKERVVDGVVMVPCQVSCHGFGVCSRCGDTGWVPKSTLPFGGL